MEEGSRGKADKGERQLGAEGEQSLSCRMMVADTGKPRRKLCRR